jgi:hypothetical protein
MLGGVDDGCSEQREGDALAAVGGVNVQAGDHPHRHVVQGRQRS